jgi:bla regulator protein blaR1
MQGPDIINLVISGLIKPLFLTLVIGMIFLLIHKRSAAIKHFCLLMGMLSLLILPISSFLMPDMAWQFPLSGVLFQSLPFAWQEYLFKTSYINIDPLIWQWMLGIYLLVSTSILFYLLIGFIQLWQIYNRSAVVQDHETLLLVNEIRQLFGISRRVVLVSSQQIESPCVWGILAPKILLPENYQQWSYEQKVSVFMHELGHIHRYDALSLLIVRITCAVFWFLLPVWWFARKMARDSEMACDDLIYRMHNKQVQYAEHLLQIANHEKTDSRLVVPMSGHSEIYHRIMAVLDSKKPRQAVQAESIQYPLLISVFMLMILAALDNVTFFAEENTNQRSVFNLVWAPVSSSKNETINQVEISSQTEAEKVIAVVDALQSQQRPTLIVHVVPPREKINGNMPEEYKTNVEVDKNHLQFSAIETSPARTLKKSDVYRSLSWVEPEYPVDALEKGINGFVKISFDLDARGTPINFHIMESQPAGIFDQSVIRAMRNSRFEWLDQQNSPQPIQKHFVFQMDTRRKR